MAPVRRVLVVGAGCSGLVTIKECREEGLDVVCLEAQPWIGGLWHFTENESHSSVYRSTVINTSKEMMSFSDFLVPKEFPPYMHHTQCLEYFNMYADHFNLRPHIRFNTRVHSVKPASDYDATGRYTVRYQEKDQAEVEETFDAVVVCSGHHWIPRTPTFPGLDTFKGTTMHAHAYKDARGFENKHVVVVGVGNSGVVAHGSLPLAGLDVAVELSRFSKQVYLVTRSGTWLLARIGPGGIPVDYYITTRATALLPLSVRNLVGEMQMTSTVDLDLYGLTPKHHLLSAHPSVNGELIGRIATGSVKVRPNIRAFRENAVVYDDGQELPCDAVVFATGYDIGFPYLDPACGITVTDNEVSLFKFVFPPRNKHATLCTVGFIQPIGGIMPLSELQARWTARVFSGKVKLPSEGAMLKDIHATREDMRRRYVPSRRHTVQVDYVEYANEIAEMIGCRPAFWPIFLKDPERHARVLVCGAPVQLAIAMWTAGVVAAQYRVVGPKAWPGAREAILGAKDRIVYATSGGKHLRDIAKLKQGNNTLRSALRLVLLLVAIYAVRTAIRNRRSI